MNDEILKEYAEVCAEEKAITAKKELLKEQIELVLGQQSISEKREFGSFTMVGRTSYTYSDKVKEASENLAIQKKDEEEQGIAESKINYSLRFMATK